jgi:hypothetical protein
VLDGEVHGVDGVWVSTPARTWLDLAHELTPVALVALGDQLIRRPREQFEHRSEPYSTKVELFEMLRAHPKVKGVGKCKDALKDMRIGSDSVPETMLRLSLVAYGFPEPELQLILDPQNPRSPTADQGYRGIQVAIQYEGAHHQEPEQQAKDEWRDRCFSSAGWATIHATAEDLADDFARVRRELRRLMLKRG